MPKPENVSLRGIADATIQTPAPACQMDATGAWQSRFTDDLGIDEPLAEYESGTGYYFHADGLGSIIALSYLTGGLAASYTYDSFGNLIATSTNLHSPFGYTARERDNETGFYYYRARYYDPTVGRFVSDDPIGFEGGSDFYTYVRNRPTHFRDPLGLVAAGIGINAVGVAGAGPAAGAGEANCMIVWDGKNWGLLCCAGLGGGVAGGGLTGSIEGRLVVCPTCKTICDMAEGFVDFQIFGDVGEGAAGGLGGSLSLRQLSIIISGGPAEGVGAGATVISGECKLVLGGKGCKKCAAQPTKRPGL